jgi:Mg2+ and Co2+ transporter CorA
MQIDSFEIRDDGSLARLDHIALIDRWRAGGGPYWVVFRTPESESLVRHLSALGVEPDLALELLEPGHAARVLPLERGIFFELPARIAGEPPELKSLTFLCLDRVLVTIYPTLEEDPAASLEGFVAGLRVDGASTTELLAAVLLQLSVNLRNHSTELRSRVLTLSRRMDDDPDSVTPQDLLEVKREILDLEAAAEERIPVLETLEQLRTEALDPELLGEGLQIALGNTTATSRRLDRQERRAEDLQSRFDAHQQEKANRRLGRLTIISAVFLPLTLIAGIYGMNFDVMPELHLAYAYPVTLLGMLLITVVMIWWFRDRGWMD